MSDHSTPTSGPRRSQREPMQTQFYGNPNVHALHSKIRDDLSSVASYMQNIYEMIEVNAPHNGVTKCYNEAVQTLNQAHYDFSEFKRYVNDPELKGALTDTKCELKRLGDAVKVHKRASLELLLRPSAQHSLVGHANQPPGHPANFETSDQQSECGSHRSVRSTASSMASRTSTASKARAEAMKSRLRLQQIDSEAKLKLQLDRLKLTNEVELNEELARALEEETEPANHRLTSSPHAGFNLDNRSLPRLQPRFTSVSPEPVKRLARTEPRIKTEPQPEQHNVTFGELFTKFLPGYGPDPVKSEECAISQKFSSQNPMSTGGVTFDQHQTNKKENVYYHARETDQKPQHTPIHHETRKSVKIENQPRPVIRQNINLSEFNREQIQQNEFRQNQIPKKEILNSPRHSHQSRQNLQPLDPKAQHFSPKTIHQIQPPPSYHESVKHRESTRLADQIQEDKTENHSLQNSENRHQERLLQDYPIQDYPVQHTVVLGKPTPTPDLFQASLMIQQKTSRLMYLNSLQPTKFAGQPKHYPHFKQRIDSLLADGVLADHESVEMLPKFLEGEPLQVVKNMTGRSYQSIVSRLTERYGHPTLVANDHIQDLVSGPQLGNNDRKGLLSLADSLVTTAETLTGQYLATASCQPNMEKIVNRLPMYLRNSWEKKVSQICDEKCGPELSDLARFVEKAAKTKNNPFYQAQSQTQPRPEARLSNNSNNSNSNFRPPPRQFPAPRPPLKPSLPSMPTEVKSTTPNFGQTNPRKKVPCAVCAQDHKTWLCPSLKAEKGPNREKLVRTKNLCIVCFVLGCRHLTCPRRDDKFVCQTCPIRHHKLLECKKPYNPVENNAVEVLDSEEEDTNAEDQETDLYGESSDSVQNYAINSGAKDFMLGLIPINVHGPEGKTISTYAFLDTGSKGSFIDETLANELGITGPKQCRFVKTIVGRRRQNLKKVAFEISNMKTGTRAKVGYQTYSFVGVSLEQKLGDENVLPSSLDFTNFDHLRKLKIPVPDRCRIGLLIGLPVREAHEVLGYHKGGPNEPYGIETVLGTAVVGPIGEVNEIETLGVNVTSILIDPPQRQFLGELCSPPTEPEFGPILELLERFWRLEDYGTNLDPKSKLAPQEKRALDIFYRTLNKVHDGHYESGLMWVRDDIKIPYNRHIALAKLKTLLKRLRNDPVFAAMYIKSMNEYIDNGWASLVPEDEIDLQNGRVCYLSHFAVTNPNKPGKVRSVFNAAEEYEGVSLNSLLIPGPDTSCSLLGVLLRSRFGKYCFAADVKAMFNQCFVRKEDRDALRFLWIDKNGDIKDYRMNIHVFGAADSPFCANKILKQIGIDNKSEYRTEVISAVVDNFYVDDSMVSSGQPEKMVAMATELKSLLSKGGMELTKFTSNCNEVLRALDPKDWAKPDTNLDIDPMPIERTLGLQWNIANDCFGYKISSVSKPDTLRGMTSVVARTFDPIGGTAPVMLTPKRLIQDCFRRKCNWDDPLPTDILNAWNNWKKDFHLLENIQIPRPYFPSVPDCRDGLILQLHLFSDSCEYATGAAAYLRGEEPRGEIHVGFVMGKSKLLPLQPVLYEPKGELKAAVDLVRLGKKLVEELRLKLSDTVYWTDSQLVLKYINNETKSFKPFVANRRSEIREKSDVTQWRHCPGILNVSDDASRGVNSANYTSSHRYLTGPPFLKTPEQEWPHGEIDELSEDDSQIKKPKPIAIHKIAISTEDQIGKLILSKSNIRKMKKVAAWCIRFGRNALAARAARKKLTTTAALTTGPLTLNEIADAYDALIRYVQQNTFSEEISALSANKKLPSKSNLLSLNPFLDPTGLLRVGGRLSRAPLDYCVRHPVILPKPNACHLSATIIINFHAELLHGGTNLLLGKLCETGHWIIHARSFVRRSINDCVICRKRNAQPMTQLMSDLPSDRVVTHEPSFTNTGTDCFGPMLCKEGRRRDSRYYGVLFLCLNTKAIHLELVKNLTTDDFIKALMRFIALRNNVKSIRSDNGSNYIGAERELRELVQAWNAEQISEKMSMKNIDWTFQLPYASSMSGVWERQVKEVKRHIYAVLKTQQPDPDSLRTLLYEVSSIVNQSPLSPVTDDPTSYDVITPAHFLFQRPATSLIPVPTTDHDNYYRKTWRQVQFLADCFWKRHLKTFIPSLQLRRKWQKTRRNLKINDLVLLTHLDLPRSRWAYGRVLEVFPGKDGLVRSARVKTRDGVYLRPIQRLALIRASEN